MYSHLTLAACAYMCLPVAALASPAHPSTETVHRSAQEQRDIWIQFFALMDTVHDKETADKAAAEIRKLTQKMVNTASKTPSLTDDDEIHRRQGYELKKRLITHQYYLSDDLETVMYDPDTPFNAVVRADMDDILPMQSDIIPQKPMDNAPDVRPETGQIVQKYNAICDTFDTIHDKKVPTRQPRPSSTFAGK